MRSHFGCSTCRLRKLKCDEAKPTCGPCKKASRSCQFPESTAFRNFEGPEIFDDGTTWLPVPDKLVFLNVEDPYQPDASQSPGLELASEVPDVQQPSDVEVGPIATSPLAASINQPDDDTIMSPPPNSPVSADIKVLELQLMRHFNQVLSRWMDAFDTTAFFSCKVPSMAIRSPVLKVSVCALAAKHLGRVHHSAKARNGAIDGTSNAFWSSKSIQYHDRAVSLLKGAVDLQTLDNGTTQTTANSADVAALFASIAILSMSELADAPRADGWRAHMLALPWFNSSARSEFSGSTFPLDISRGPIFWSLVRQDFYYAFLSERQTRLDVDDILFWQNPGLAADANGGFLPFSPFDTVEYRASTDIPEDARSNELFWLLGKIINYLTAGDAVNPEDFALPADQRFPLGVPQEQLLERWTILDLELRKWLGTLPSTFQATARTPIPQGASHDDQPDTPGIQQVWYELPICAATMQAYHMASILLLTNKPQESTFIRSTLSARFRHYRKVQDTILWHAREICGISLADPPDWARIHSVLPLLVAGQVFYVPQEQEIVTALLLSIEQDLGWATYYHRDKLASEWAKEHE